jgi:hypothetical protein
VIFQLIFFYQLCLILVCIFIPSRYKPGIKIPSFHRNIAKKIIKQKNILFSCIWPSLSKKKNHIVLSYNKNSKNICFSMHFNFNNQFIKAMRTWPIFQKYLKNILFFLVSRITNFYVKCIPDLCYKLFLGLTNKIKRK